MEFAPEVLAIVIGFMILSNRLIAALVTPVFEKYNLDKFWLMYASWVLSGVFVWLADVNLFEAFIASELIGKIITAVVAGGGANLLHDLTDVDDLILIEDEE
jgi:hypothetical protein